MNSGLSMGWKMNLETLFLWLCWSWFAAEALIAVVMRTRRTGGRTQDRGSQLLVWSLAFGGLMSSDWVEQIAPWTIFGHAPCLIPLSLGIFVVGLTIRGAAIVTLGSAFSVNVAIRNTQKVQRAGLYRLVRHPSYLGLEVAFFAIGLNKGNWACLATIFLLPTLGTLYRIHVEEEVLRGAFGEEYATYCRTTRRLIPGLFVFAICAIALASQTASGQTKVGNSISGGAKAEILNRYIGSELLPKPERVVIQDFTNAGPIVMDDHGHRHHGSEADATPDELVRQIQDSFAKTLIGVFKKIKLESGRVLDSSTIAGPVLIVQGEFLAVDQGNSRERIIVGFGRGESDIKAHVIISEVANGQRTVLLECNINSGSGKKPGAILSTNGEGFAAGVVTGHFGDKRSATVQADASRMAKLVGKQTKAIMIAQRWIADPNRAF